MVLLFSSFMAKHDLHILEIFIVFSNFVFSFFSMLELSKSLASRLNLRYYSTLSFSPLNIASSKICLSLIYDLFLLCCALGF